MSFCDALAVGTVTLATTCGRELDTELEIVNDASDAGATAWKFRGEFVGGQKRSRDELANVHVPEPLPLMTAPAVADSPTNKPPGVAPSAEAEESKYPHTRNDDTLELKSDGEMVAALVETSQEEFSPSEVTNAIFFEFSEDRGSSELQEVRITPPSTATTAAR